MTIIFGFLISQIYAVSDIKISPSNPKVGDTITLTGKANPNEDINCQAWFELNPITSPPYYGYIMNGVEIPSSPNNFKVIGENVNDLSVSIKTGMWITKSANANSNGVAVVSKSDVPTGTYDIKIGGTIKDTSKPVKLKIIASTTIKADENGNFKYTYKTNNIPEGTIVYLNIGGVNKEVVIRGNIPIPPSPPVVNDTTTNNTPTNTITTNTTTIHKDNEPPKIIILSPSKKDYNISHVDFEVIVKDESDYTVKFYLNDDSVKYTNSGNHYTGSLNLKEGINTFKIITKDEYNNENSQIVYINYQKPNQENKSSNVNNNKNNNDSTKGQNPNKIDNDIQNNNNNPEPNANSKQENKENIVYGTIIKHVGNATLIISDGTEISTSGDIQIKKVILPNTTLAYYISPNNAEFSKPLTLKISLDVPEGREFKILYYDEQLKYWRSVPYIYDKNSSEITINVAKSGYYAIKENDIPKNKNTSIFDEIISVIKLIINIIVSLINSKLNIV